MKRKMISAAVVFALLLFCVSAQTAMGDLIYLKKGGVLEGIIGEETGDEVEVDMGFGTTAIKKSEIKEIKRSSAEELKALTAKWEAKKKELRAKEAEFSRERDERFSEYGKWRDQVQEERAKDDVRPKLIQASRDPRSEGILVDVVLNGKTKAVLVLDTGAFLVVLSKRKGQELGIDLSDTKKNVIDLRLAADRTVKAKTLVLNSIAVQDAVEKDVLAAVLMEESSQIGFRDGLLGRSFLNRFNMRIDHKTMKLTLEKIR